MTLRQARFRLVLVRQARASAQQERMWGWLRAWASLARRVRREYIRLRKGMSKFCGVEYNQSVQSG
jgi:hypothetical protein